MTSACPWIGGSLGLTNNPNEESTMSNVVIPFGKHRGSYLHNVDPGYLTWLLRKANEPDAWSGLVTFVDTHEADIREALREAQLGKLEASLPQYTLNEGQRLAAENLKAWLQGSEPVAKLEGGAGYGKTFCVVDVVAEAVRSGYRVAAGATSYVATQVLLSQLDPLGVEVKTLARHLRLEKVTRGQTEDYLLGEKTPEALAELLSAGHLLVVDEYSMVGDDVADALLGAARQYGGRLLAVGDLKQLPPVGQNHPNRIAQVQVSETLTQPMRYSVESDLYQVEQLARQNPYDLLNTGSSWGESEQVRVVGSREELVDEYVRDYEQDPQGNARLYFFTRRDVVAANREVRARLFGQDAPLVVEDEHLVVNATSDVLNGKENLFRPGEPGTDRFYSGTQWVVTRFIESRVLAEGLEVPCYVADLVSPSGEVRKNVPLVFSVSESRADEATLGGVEYNAHLRALAEEAEELGNWARFHAFKRHFLPVAYGYASTVHKAQGQTVDRAYILPRQLVFAGGRGTGEKLLYVAATRARRKLTMVL